PFWVIFFCAAARSRVETNNALSTGFPIASSLSRTGISSPRKSVFRFNASGGTFGPMYIKLGLPIRFDVYGDRKVFVITADLDVAVGGGAIELRGHHRHGEIDLHFGE